MRNTDNQSTRPRGRPRRTPEERAEHRERLIKGTIKAVREYGADIPIDDLAGAVGVSKPVLYNEFGDKHGIADAVAVFLAENLERTVVESITLDESLDIGVAIRTFVEGLIDVLVNDPEVYAFVVRAIRVSDRGFLDNALVRVMHSRATILMGLLMPTTPPEIVNRMIDGLYGFVFAAVESWNVARSPSRDEFVDGLVTIIGNGVQTIADEISA